MEYVNNYGNLVQGIWKILVISSQFFCKFKPKGYKIKSIFHHHLSWSGEHAI